MPLSGATRWRPGSAIVHDSFLVRDGRVLDIDGHISRTANASGEPVSRIRPAYEDVLRSATALSQWCFPLVSLREGHMSHELRPIEPAAVRSTARLWTPPNPDPRRLPRVKGPDFDRQHSLRRQAEGHGADEAVLVGSDGNVREGAFSALVHWVDGRLVTSSCTERLPSVTEIAVVAAARSFGISVVSRACRVEEIRGADEVWALSSLHLIRVVTRWDGQPVGEAGWATRFRPRLQEMEQEISAWLAQ